jgi:MoaA/NifB/PqqE/SkfB family radical SAM enzyme
MFKFNELEKVQIEITNRCQASCPMCPRNIQGGLKNPLLKFNDWTLVDFVRVFTPVVLKQIRLLTFCGNFGEPILNNDLIAMCDFVTTNAPHIDIRIHTNGSARHLDWWKELAIKLPRKHEVIFALDGLSDTHSIYRIGTSFEKIIENAKAFIAAGGIANWHFIRFKHNEHQVEEAYNMAIELGFKLFEVKNSRRFMEEKFEVLDKTGKMIYHIEQPTDSNIKVIDMKAMEKHMASDDTDIGCYVLNDKDIYIDAHFAVTPCCFINSFWSLPYPKDHLGNAVKEDALALIDELGGSTAINAKITGLDKIIDSNIWQTIWADKWKTGSCLTCKALCSKNSPIATLQDEWTRQEIINV